MPPALPHPSPQAEAPLREALLRMRADEACIHHLNIVLAELRPGDRWAASPPCSPPRCVQEVLSVQAWQHALGAVDLAGTWTRWP